MQPMPLHLFFFVDQFASNVPTLAVWDFEIFVKQDFSFLLWEEVKA